jgi:hypothetical protein
MTKFVSMMFVVASLGCGLWGGGYGYGSYPAQAPYMVGGLPAAYPTYAAYPVDPLSGGYSVPPSNVCFLHRPPPWCQGPRCLPVGNETENHLRPWIDGVAIDLPETGGYLPPGETCWVITDSVGRHEIQAEGYIGPPPLQLVARCARSFWIDATGRGHHGVEIGNLECGTVSPTSAGR